jgi:hypothetical protein
MKIARNITILIITVFFLLPSTGVLVYHSHCSCTGSEQFSVYMAPETCEENDHLHHSHDRAGAQIPVSINECHECRTHTEDCGCNAPEVRFFRLDVQIFQDKVRIANAKPVVRIMLPLFIVDPKSDVVSLQAGMQHFTDPPPLIRSALDLLLHIQQLKIPLA